MKNIRLFLMMAILTMLLLGACTRQPDQTQKSEENTKRQETEHSNSKSSDKEKDRQEEQEKEESKDASKDQSRVWNNGREFVKVKDKIYFRKFLQGDQAAISVNGHYRTLFDGKRKSEFGYVTETNKNFVKLFDDEGYGNIFYFNDRFYLQKESDDRYLLYSIALDGSDEKIIGEYDLVDIYEPLGYFILEVRGEMQIMKDEKIIKTFKNQERDFYYYNTVIGNKMIMTRHTNDENYNSTIRLYSVNLDHLDDIVELGVIKKPDADSDIYLNSGISKVIEKDGKLWAELTMTQGSARVFVGLSIFSAQPHGENSIKLEKSLVEQDIFENVPRFDVYNGKVEFCMIPAGDMIADENGVFYNDSDSPTDEAIAYKIYSPTDYSNYYDLSYGVEVLEKVADEIYFIVNTNRYYWELGTRSTYYKLINTQYLCYDTKTKQTRAIFDLLSENTEQTAFIWISKDPQHAGKVLYQMVEYITSEDSDERKQFYGLVGEELSDSYEIVELLPFTNAAQLMDDFVFGKDPIYKGDDAEKAFYEVMSQRNAYADFVEEYGTYALPHDVGKQDGLVLAKLFFDPYGKKIQGIELIDDFIHRGDHKR